MLARQTPDPQIEVRRKAGEAAVVNVVGGVNAQGVYALSAAIGGSRLCSPLRAVFQQTLRALKLRFSAAAKAALFGYETYMPTLKMTLTCGHMTG